MKANPYQLILYIGFKLLFVSSSSSEQRENDSERVISLDTLRSSIKDLGLSESDIAEIQVQICKWDFWDPAYFLEVEYSI